MIQKETKFSVYQTYKILNHFGLKYSDILCNKTRQISIEQDMNEKLEGSISKEKYKDESDLFCYFLITSVLFIHQTRIIQWINFERNNFFRIKKDEKELVILTHYIAQCSKNEETLKIYKMKEENQSTETEQCNNEISKNIRFCYHRI